MHSCVRVWVLVCLRAGMRACVRACNCVLVHARAHGVRALLVRGARALVRFRVRAGVLACVRVRHVIAHGCIPRMRAIDPASVRAWACACNPVSRIADPSVFPDPSFFCFPPILTYCARANPCVRATARARACAPPPSAHPPPVPHTCPYVVWRGVPWRAVACARARARACFRLVPKFWQGCR